MWDFVKLLRLTPARRLVALGVFALLTLAPATGAADDNPAVNAASTSRVEVPVLTVRLPKDEFANFSGVVNFDQAGINMGEMLYPAPSAAGFLAAIATHGFLMGHMKEKQKAQMREAADKVLEPYQPAISHMRMDELMQRAIAELDTHGDKHLIPFTERSAQGLLLEGSPQFYMTPDARALIIENLVLLAPTPDAGKRHTVTVKIVDAPRDEPADQIESYWLRDNGASLLATSARLLQESLLLALEESRGLGSSSTAFTTIRYREGGRENMERAQLIKDENDQLIVRTLRGWILAVPANRPVASNTTAPDVKPTAN